MRWRKGQGGAEARARIPRTPSGADCQLRMDRRRPNLMDQAGFSLDLVDSLTAVDRPFVTLSTSPCRHHHKHCKVRWRSFRVFLAYFYDLTQAIHPYFSVVFFFASPPARATMSTPNFHDEGDAPLA